MSDITYKDVYRQLIKDHPKYAGLREALIRRMFLSYFGAMIGNIIRGARFRIPLFGSIYVKKCPRIHVNKNGGAIVPKQIDWNASRIKKKEFLETHSKEELFDKDFNPTGFKWIVFHDVHDPFYFKFDWLKSNALPGQLPYTFIPTRGPKGISRKLAKVLLTEPTVKDEL